MARLISISKIIKFDIRMTPLETLSVLLKKLRKFPVRFLAEKVESHEEFKEAVSLGFDFFQGYFFSRPEVLEGKSIETPQMNLLSTMAEANKRDVRFDRLEKIIERDVGISYKLLRYINSAYYRPVSEIKSIRHAIALLGERGIRRFLSLIAMSSLAIGKPNELVRESMIRASFCEKLANREMDQAELFTLGLFSLIDAIMDRPMAVLMKELPLAETIKNALVKGDGNYGDILRLISNYEQGRWDGVDGVAERLGLDGSKLPDYYTESVAWADSLSKAN
jgi:EAL and modified HD-GYP domain-containing signal transduction protein